MPDLKPKLLVLEMRHVLQTPSKDKPGLKFVVFLIKAKDYTKGFDYGFANWTGTEWEELDASLTVVKWAELPNPSIIL